MRSGWSQPFLILALLAPAVQGASEGQPDEDVQPWGDVTFRDPAGDADRGIEPASGPLADTVDMLAVFTGTTEDSFAIVFRVRDLGALAGPAAPESVQYAFTFRAREGQAPQQAMASFARDESETWRFGLYDAEGQWRTVSGFADVQGDTVKVVIPWGADCVGDDGYRQPISAQTWLIDPREPDQIGDEAGEPAGGAAGASGLTVTEPPACASQKGTESPEGILDMPAPWVGLLVLALATVGVWRRR